MSIIKIICDSTSPTNSCVSFVDFIVSRIGSVCDSTSPTNKKKVSYNNKIQNNKIQNNNDEGVERVCRRGVVEDGADTRNSGIKDERVYIVSCGTTGKGTNSFVSYFDYRVSRIGSVCDSTSPTIFFDTLAL